MLTPGDAERMAKHLGVAMETLEESLAATHGPLVQKSGPPVAMAFRVPLITPKVEGGRCVFLQPDGMCRVHAAAPFGCSHCDAHMNREDVTQRSKVAIVAAMASPDYLAMHKRLVAAGRVMEPVTVRRQKHEMEQASKVGSQQKPQPGGPTAQKS